MRWSLPTVIASVGGAVAGVLLVTLVGGTLADALVAPRIADRETAAQLAAASLENTFEQAQDRLELVALRLEPWTGTPMNTVGMAHGLSRLGEAADIDAGLLVIASEGRVVAADPSHASLIGRPHETDASNAAFDGTEPAPALVKDPTNSADTLRVAAPIHDQAGRIAAVLEGGISVAGGQVSQALAGIGLAEQQSPALVSPDGRVITPEGINDIPATGDPNLAAPIASTGAGSLRYDGEADQPMFATRTSVGDGWTLVIREPETHLVGGIARPVTITFSSLAGLLLASLIGFFWQRRRVHAAEAQAEQAKHALLSVAGHELRTPLTVVRGVTATLLEHWERIPDPQRRQLLKTIERQSRSLGHLVERLLFAAHLEAGLAAVVNAVPMRLAPLLRAAVHQHTALSPSHDFSVDVDDDLAAYADAKALDQMLFHLLENAVRFSPGGGSVWVSAVRSGQEVLVVVEDEGVGLPADTDRLFERFTQSEHVDTRTREEGGVGLGLHIVRTLAAAMDAHVEAEHGSRGGARFIIRLRRAPRRAHPSQAPTPDKDVLTLAEPVA